MNFSDLDKRMSDFFVTLSAAQAALERFSREIDKADGVIKSAFSERDPERSDGPSKQADAVLTESGKPAQGEIVDAPDETMGQGDILAMSEGTATTEESPRNDAPVISVDPLALDNVPDDTGTAVEQSAKPASEPSRPAMTVNEFRDRVNEQFLRGSPGTVAAHTRPLLDKYAGKGQGMRAIPSGRYVAFIEELTALTDSLLEGGDA